MCFTCFFQWAEWLIPTQKTPRSYQQEHKTISVLHVLSSLSCENTRKWILIPSACTEKSRHIKVSMMINTAAQFSMKAGGLDWCSEAASVRLLPAGRAKSKQRPLREGGYKSSHLGLEVNIKMCTLTVDGHQSDQCIALPMSIIGKDV